MAVPGGRYLCNIELPKNGLGSLSLRRMGSPRLDVFRDGMTKQRGM
jgi:hypothetical protein